MSLEHSPARQGGHVSSNDEIGTIDDACREIGGTKPISKATYYRGVKAKIFEPPFHPSPGISRVNLTRLRKGIHERARAE